MAFTGSNSRIRQILMGVCLLFCSVVYARTPGTPVAPRMRVIVDNDFSGDPDGLFQLAHLLLSPSVELRGIIGSHLRPHDGFDTSAHQAAHAASRALELLRLLSPGSSIPVMAGAEQAIIPGKPGQYSQATAFIIKEALRTDTKLPLYLLCGAGLTEVALALKADSTIAGRFTLVWIGGPEYPGMAVAPPGAAQPEYNLNIDIQAAAVVFSNPQLSLWQVPRNAYRQCLVSFTQLQVNVKSMGAVGAYLFAAIDRLQAALLAYHLNIGETYILGDSPLILLTALQSSFEPDPSSSDYTALRAPLINDHGNYQVNPGGRLIRVYQHLDTRPLFDDFFAKLETYARGQ